MSESEILKMRSTEPVQVHCSECTRGGNGDKSCSCGWNVKNKRGDNKYRMCFAGTKIKEESK